MSRTVPAAFSPLAGHRERPLPLPIDRPTSGIVHVASQRRRFSRPAAAGGTARKVFCFDTAGLENCSREAISRIKSCTSVVTILRGLVIR